jgi:hypothetical protein
MSLSLPEILLVIFSIALTYVFIRSIVRGEVEWDIGKDALIITRAKDPFTYWFLILFQITLICVMSWLIFN